MNDFAQSKHGSREKSCPEFCRFTPRTTTSTATSFVANSKMLVLANCHEQPAAVSESPDGIRAESKWHGSNSSSVRVSHHPITLQCYTLSLRPDAAPSGSSLTVRPVPIPYHSCSRSVNEEFFAYEEMPESFLVSS